jgi:hypothetical protein
MHDPGHSSQYIQYNNERMIRVYHTFLRTYDGWGFDLFVCESFLKGLVKLLLTPEENI